MPEQFNDSWSYEVLEPDRPHHYWIARVVVWEGERHVQTLTLGLGKERPEAKTLAELAKKAVAQLWDETATTPAEESKYQVSDDDLLAGLKERGLLDEKTTNLADFAAALGTAAMKP